MNRNDDAVTSDRVWTLADAIPGEPERDYPIFSEIPETDFSCDGRNEGKIYGFISVPLLSDKWIKIPYQK